MTDSLKITCDTIINYLQSKIENKEPIDPSTWLDGAMKLSILVGDEQDLLYDLQQQVAQEKVRHILEGSSVAKAKVMSEATEVYKQAKKQEAKIETIFENIRLSKVHAKIASNEWQSQR